MDISARLRNSLNAVIKRRGYELISSKLLYDWQRFPQTQLTQRWSELPPDAVNYLQQSNPRLKELQDRYAAFDTEVTVPSVWKDGHIGPENTLYFRGDNAYVWQMRGKNMNVMAYALTALYAQSIDKLSLMDVLEEDDLFGNFTFCLGNKLFSRDLLDSVLEIYFLQKQLNISLSKDLKVLDIGAGYGRLAHRMVTAMPNIKNYFCTDGVAVSTFISEYYLHFRNLTDRAKAVPLDEIENTLKNGPVDIALNIHSFSECTTSAIQWWLSVLAKYGTKYLMIVPNTGLSGGNILLSCDPDGRKDYMAVVEKSGYKLIAKEPKYEDPLIHQFAINPTYYYLFELR